MIASLLHVSLPAATIVWVGGSGNWDASSLSWSGSAWNNANLDIASFISTAGTVTLTTPITAGGLIFTTGGYTLTGSTLTFGQTGVNALETDTGTTIINSVITGGPLNRLVKTGAGTLTLSATNTFTGGMTLSAGILQWATGGELGSSGTVFVNDANTGTADVSLLGTTFNTTLARNVTVMNLGSGVVTLGGAQQSGLNPVRYSGTLTFNRAVSLTSPTGADRTDYSGNITGNVGTLTITGGGRTTFVGAAKTFTGDVLITGSGTSLQIGVVSSAGDLIPNASSITVNAGAVLRLSALNEEFGGLNGSGTVNSNSAPSGGVFTIGSQNLSGSFSGAIGSGGTGLGITKIGSGSQVFSGSDTYTGITTVTGGILRGTQTSGTPFGVGSVVLNGGVLSLAPTGSGTVSVTGASTATTSTLTYGGGGTIQWIRGTNTALTYTVGNASPSGTVLVRTNSGTLTLDYSSSAALGVSEKLIIRGLTSAANLNGIYDASVVAFTGSTGTFVKYVDSTTGFALAESSTSIYTIRSGTLAASTLSGTEVSDIATGTQFGGDNTAYAARLTGAVTFGAGGTIFTVNGSAGSGGLILNAATLGTTTTRGVLAFGAAEGLVFTGGSSTVNSVITGSAGVTTFGPGTLTLTGANTFTGGLNINQGTLSISSANQLGAGIVTLNGGTLVSTATTSISAGQAFVMGVAGGTISPAASTSLTINTGVTGTAGTLVKSGAGTLILSSTAAGTLPTFIDVTQGVLQLSGGAFAVDKMQGSGLITVRSGATLSISNDHGLGGSNGGMTESVVIAGGTLNLNAFDQYFNNLNLQGAQVNVANTGSLRPSNAGNFFINGTATSTITGTGDGQIDLTFDSLNLNVMDVTGTSAADLILALPVNGASSSFTFNLNGTGTGTVAVNGTNTYVGATNISSGTFQVGNASALGGVASLPVVGTNDTYVSGNGVLDLNGFTNINESIKLSGTGILGGGALVNSSASAASIGSGIAGIIQTAGGTGNPTITVTGGGGTGAMITAAAGVSNYTITQSGSGFTSTPTLTFSTGTYAATAVLAGVVLTGDASIGGSGDIAINGIISESGGSRALQKVGSNTLQLNNLNTYTGATVVSAGMLQVGSAGVGQTGSGAVTVQNGGTILGTGLVQGSSFTAESGSSIQAGDGTAQGNYGTLSFTPVSGSGSFDFQSGSNVILGINPGGAGDLLSFNGLSAGALLFNGNLQVTASSYTPTSVQTFKLLDWTNLSTITFASQYSTSSYSGYLLGNGDDTQGFDLPDISGSGYGWDISQFTVNGTISTVNLVPEPARMILLFGGLIGIRLRRRRLVNR